MKLSWGAGHSLAARWCGGALGLIRPGAEAALLAGVAISCAQLVWHVADSEAAEPVVDQHLASQPVATDEPVRSPFAPFAGGQAASAQRSELAAIRLAGVRVSDKPDRSGAVLTLGDGAQRSFLIGFEIIAGVRLASVASDHVVLDWGGGEQVIALDGRPRTDAPLFALATPPASPATTPGAWPGAEAVQFVSMQMPDPSSSLASMMANGVRLESRSGAPYGWRVLNVPASLAQGGLATGDLVVSVNGAGPADGIAALSGAARRPLQLVVERAGGQRVSLQFVDGLPS